MFKLQINAQSGEHFKKDMADIKTVGLKDLLGFELQIVICLDPELIGLIFVDFITKKISAQEKNDPSILTEFPFKTYKISEEMTRIILPDMNGKYPEDPHCEAPFSKQYDSPRFLS